MRSRFALLFAGCLPLVVLAAGCGGGGDAPPLAPVTGTVKLEGQPVKDAVVVFTPKDGGAPAAGRTDENGHYELIYSRSEKGAMVGDHVVTITTYQSQGEDGQEVPETIPVKYNEQSELMETVENKSNVIDFNLEAGEVVQPSKDQ